MLTCAGHIASHGRFISISGLQECSTRWLSYSSAKTSRLSSTAGAASQPMAQSEVSRIMVARSLTSSSREASASQSRILQSILLSCGSPSRQGMHLPQVCAALASVKVTWNAIGHMPVGVAPMRRSNFSMNVAMRASTPAFGVILTLLTVTFSFLVCGYKDRTIMTLLYVCQCFECVSPRRRHEGADDARGRGYRANLARGDTPPPSRHCQTVG